MYQMSHVGPIIGQTGHFVNQAPEKIPYAIQRFVGESVRIVGVLNTGLQGRDHLAGDYSIADIAPTRGSSPPGSRFRNMMPEKIGEFGNVQRWLDRLRCAPRGPARDGDPPSRSAPLAARRRPWQRWRPFPAPRPAPRCRPSSSRRRRQGEPGPGGWGAIVVTPDGRVTELGGSEPHTTNKPHGAVGGDRGAPARRPVARPVAVHTDSTYLIRGIRDWIHGWRARLAHEGGRGTS